MAVVKFLPANSLKFVWKEGYKFELQNDTNRLDKDFSYQDRQFEPYCNYIDQTDNLFFQFITDYTDFTIYRIKVSDGTNSTLTPILINSLENGYRQYQINVPISSLTGEYYINCSFIQPLFPIATFESETFIVEKNSELMLFEWYGNGTMNDAFIWLDDPLSLRLDANLKKMLSDEDREVYLDTDGNYENTYSQDRNLRQLIIDSVPEWVMQILKKIIQHDHFYINGIEYSCDSGWEYEATENRRYSASLKVNENDFNNPTVYTELQGNIPVYDEVLRTTGLDTRTTGLDDRKINN